MKIKSFKRFLNEDNNKEFNSFVEEVIETGKIDSTKTKSFTDEDNYTGILYRVVFHDKAEVEKYFSEETVDVAGLARYTVSKMNPNRYVKFSKSLMGIKNYIDYPNVIKFKQQEYNTDDEVKYIGIIFSIRPHSSIDLTKYKGKREIEDRLEKTEEVLSNEDMTIRKIDGLYMYEGGWHFITDFTNRTKVIGEPREDHLNQQPEAPEQSEQPNQNLPKEQPNQRKI